MRKNARKETTKQLVTNNVLNHEIFDIHFDGYKTDI